MQRKIKRIFRKYIFRSKTILLASLVIIIFGLIIININKSNSKISSNVEASTTSIYSDRLTCSNEDSSKMIYLTLNKKLEVEEAIYQTIYTDSKKINQDKIDSFNSVHGITSTLKEYPEYYMLTTKIDYKIINLDQVKKDLKKYIKKMAVKKVYKLPVKYSDYQKTELKGYTCE